MNILVTSVGRRVNIIEYFKRALNNFDEGQILAADCSPHAAALYAADKGFVVPRIDEENYLENLLEICSQNGVDLVLSLIDPELLILAQNRDLFESKGIRVLVSDPDAVRICFDKYLTSKFLIENDLPAITTFRDPKNAYAALDNGRLAFPLMVKPIRGSASKGISRVDTERELEAAVNTGDQLIIQEFIQGQEYGIDLFCDRPGRVISIFVKKKFDMRAGETDRAVSVKNTKLFQMTSKLAAGLKAYGPLDIDCFRRDDGRFVFSEINPRFGGGYPLAYACGQDFMEYTVRMQKGETLKQRIGDYPEGRYLFKYNGIRIVEEDELVEKQHHT